jgi:hypothetical protein
MTSHEHPDETLQAIRDVIATMGQEEAPATSVLGGVALPAEYVQHTVSMSPSIVGDPQLETTYRGLADEMLRNAGAGVTDELRNALAEHLGSGVLEAVGGAKPGSELEVDDPVQQFLAEAEAGVRDGSLLKTLVSELEEVKRFVAESTGPPPRTFIGRWRARRAEEAATAERYAERQAELRELRGHTRDQGYLDMRDLQPDDEISLSMRTHPIDPQVVTATLHGRVEGFETVEEGRYAGQRGVVIRVAEEERTYKKTFVSDPLPEDSRIVLVGTGLPSNLHMQHGGRIAHDQTPIILWRGRSRTITARSEHFGNHTRNLHIDQMTVNGTTMLPDELPTERM